MVVARSSGEQEMGNYQAMGIEFQLYKMNKPRDLLYNIVSIVSNAVLSFLLFNFGSYKASPCLILFITMESLISALTQDSIFRREE